MTADPIVAHLIDRGRPVTRATYMALVFPEGAPRLMPAEYEESCATRSPSIAS